MPIVSRCCTLSVECSRKRASCCRSRRLCGERDVMLGGHTTVRRENKPSYFGWRYCKNTAEPASLGPCPATSTLK